MQYNYYPMNQQQQHSLVMLPHQQQQAYNYGATAIPMPATSGGGVGSVKGSAKGSVKGGNGNLTSPHSTPLAAATFTAHLLKSSLL